MIGGVMENTVLDRFERQVDALLRNFERLKRDNIALRTKQHVLLNERNAVTTKTDKAIHHIRRLIGRLKAIESTEE